MALEVFSIGKKVDSLGREYSFSAEDLKRCAEVYDPIGKHRAPLLKLHDESQPAGGLVASLSFDGNKLIAIPEKVQPEFAQDVIGGQYPSISPKFYPPDHPSNPTPGTWYLRHVAFVPVPSCKGLKPPEFADDDGCPEFGSVPQEIVTVFRNLREWLIESESLETADKIVPSWVLEMIAHENIEKMIASRLQMMKSEDDETEYKEKEVEPKPDKTAEFADRELRLAFREAEIAKKWAELRRAEFVAFADQNIAKITPAQKDNVVAILDSIGSAEFAESAGTVDKFKAFVSSLPDRFSLTPATADNRLSEFSDPGNDSTVIAQKITQIKQERGCNDLEAVAILVKGGK